MTSTPSPANPPTAAQLAAEALSTHSEGRIAISTEPLYLTATAPARQRRVALVSGGGSGHEPMHGGFVGAGGLDAVAPGDVFASPHNRQIYAAAKAVALPGGVLFIVKNYTGDRINFSIAAERLRREGVAVATVLVDEDLASRESDLGGRGTAGTVLVEKILGAAADQGASLTDLVELGRQVVAASRSLGVARRSLTLPSTGRLAFELPDGALEYGVGIHGERGIRQETAADLAEVAARMADDLLTALPGDDELLLLVNDLGGLAGVELAGVEHAARRALAARGAAPSLIITGAVCTALDMQGFSLTLLRVSAAMRPLLLADHDTPALPRPARVQETARSAAPAAAGTPSEPPGELLRRLERDVRAHHDMLTELDRVAGDGDFGDNLLGGVLAAKRRGGSDLDRLAAAFLDDIGGSSGPLLGLLFQEIAAAGSDNWTNALAPAAQAIMRVGDARAGDRTLLDALIPAQQEAERGGSPKDVVRAAMSGAAATATMRARRGRSVYLAERALGTPDPGALGVAIILQALAGTDVPLPG